MSEIKGIHYPAFTRDDLQIIDQHTVFQGFFRINQYRIKHKLFAGGWSETFSREMFERGHAVVVLPYCVKTDSLVLVEQFRLGAAATSASPWLLEAVAGMIAEGEGFEEVARREAQEEAGLNLGRLWPMLSYLSSPGGTTERIHLYLGELTGEVSTGVFGLPEEHEDIKVHVVSRKDALALLHNGKIDNAATLIALQWLELHLAQVRAAWES
ncbi:ADP-ribose diphosphatase [Rheinheimera sp.]|uniref:ADP-ribose diphosphatase n=1 Tax=Rheinheimera sp. TaxID=1869214 RepID=UPI002FDD7995